MSPLPAPPRAIDAHAPGPRGAWAVMRSVGFALGLRELKTRLGGRWWGLAWVVGEPLSNLVVMLLVYGMLRAHALAGVDTLLFLITGLLPFQLFKSLVLRPMLAVDANQGLFGYRQVLPIDAVGARAGVEVALGGALLVLSVIALAWLGHSVWPAHPLELMLASALLVGLGTLLGLLAAAGTGGAFTRARIAVRMVFLPLYLASGVIFPVSQLPQAAIDLLYWNPLLHLLEAIRSAFFGDAYRTVSGHTLAVPLVWALVVGVLAFGTYHLRRDRLLPL